MSSSASAIASKLSSLDLYLILEVSPDATPDEIKKSYRKRALKCHPDKNPDNPRAAELFNELTEALQVLTDSTAKAAYDKVLKARKAAELRHRKLDSQRKKLKEDLEARERQAAENSKLGKLTRGDHRDIDVEKVFAAEIERLRTHGKSLVDEQNELIRQEMSRMSATSDTKPKENPPPPTTQSPPRAEAERDTEDLDDLEARILGDKIRK